MALKAVGLDARRAVDYRDGYDFIVEDKIRVACRYAMPTSDRQQVYTKRNGEVSTYSYKRWTFNFHRHGRIPDRYCDYFVCFLVGPDAAAGSGAEVSVFVIPWGAITGLTFCSSVREGSSRGYRGKYSVYQDAWHLIERSARGRSASGVRKKLRISTDGRRRLKLMLSSADGLRPEFIAVVPAIAARRAPRPSERLPVVPAATEPIAPVRSGDGGRGGAAVKRLRAPKRMAQVIRLRAE